MWVRCFLAYTRLHWHWTTYSRAKLEDEDKIYNCEIWVACNSLTRLTVVWLGQLHFTSLGPRPLPDFILTFFCKSSNSIHVHVCSKSENHATQSNSARWLAWLTCSLFPRPSHHPVFDRLQYANTEGGGLDILSCDWCQCLPRHTEGRGKGRGGNRERTSWGFIL